MASSTARFLSPPPATSLPTNIRYYLPNETMPLAFGPRISEEMGQAHAAGSLTHRVEVLPTDPDYDFVLELLRHHPLEGQEIARIYTISSQEVEARFMQHLDVLTQINPYISWHEGRTFRRWEQASNEFSPFHTVMQNGTTKTWEKVRLLPLWHGDSNDACEKICFSGFSNADTSFRASGPFGQGHYLTTSARYASNPKNPATLVLSWGAMTRPFLVNTKNMNDAQRTGQIQDYNANFVPVHPQEKDLPCAPDAEALADVVVLYNPEQLLPRVIVQLNKTTVAPTLSPSFAPPAAAASAVAKPDPATPSPIFDASAWEHSLGDVGTEPPLPANIEEILSAPCPFWLGKSVRETHILFLLPEKVDSKTYCLNYLEYLSNKKFNYYIDDIKPKHGRTFPAGSHWVLMTRNVVPDTRSKTYEEQLTLLKGYTPPSLLEAATAILLEHFHSGAELLPKDPMTYTRCQEQVDIHRVSIRGFGADGLVIRGGMDCRFKERGLVGVRRF